MATTWVFIDKDIIISAVDYIKVDGWTKPVKVAIFTGKCDYWSTAKQDLRDRDLWRDTNIEFKDVVIEPHVNTVKIGDEVELFDINTTSIWLFVIAEIDKRRSLGGDIDNTFMRVRTRDG
jgi:hypothetical protein